MCGGFATRWTSATTWAGEYMSVHGTAVTGSGLHEWLGGAAELGQRWHKPGHSQLPAHLCSVPPASPHLPSAHIYLVASRRSLNVCYLYEVFEDDKCVDLVMELCTGGQLWDKCVPWGISRQGLGCWGWSCARAASCAGNCVLRLGVCGGVRVMGRVGWQLLGTSS